MIQEKKRAPLIKDVFYYPCAVWLIVRLQNGKRVVFLQVMAGVLTAHSEVFPAAQGESVREGLCWPANTVQDCLLGKHIGGTTVRIFLFLSCSHPRSLSLFFFATPFTVLSHNAWTCLTFRLLSILTQRQGVMSRQRLSQVSCHVTTGVPFQPSAPLCYFGCKLEPY